MGCLGHDPAVAVEGLGFLSLAASCGPGVEVSLPADVSSLGSVEDDEACHFEEVPDEVCDVEEVLVESCSGLSADDAVALDGDDGWVQVGRDGRPNRTMKVSTGV